MWWMLACQDPGPSARPDKNPRDAAHTAITAHTALGAHSADPPPTHDTGTPGAPPPFVFDGPAPRNLVVVSVDTARKDHFSRWDRQARGLTPFLDEKMREGVVFDDLTHCTNWTVASSACLFWGASLVDRAPSLGMVPILRNDNTLVQTVPDAPGLAHALTDGGFATLLVTANTWFGQAHGSVQGFSRYLGATRRPASDVWLAAAESLDDVPLASPYYLHVHYFEPHDPYLPPLSYLPAGLPDPGVPMDTDADQTAARAQFHTFPQAQQDAIVVNLQARYQAEMRWFDDQLRAIWADMDARGLLDDALVVFTTDHGEAQFEQEYFGHAWYLPPGENDAAAFFWARNLHPAVVADPHVSIDLAPTVLDLLGVPAAVGMTGQVVGRDTPRTHRTAFTDAFGGPVNSVREGDLQMQFTWRNASHPVTLCDLRVDPDCVVDLYDPAAPTPDARRLWALLQAEAEIVEPYVAADTRPVNTPPWPVELYVP